MAVFTCPQCGHSQAVDDKYVGKNATCPKCKMQGVISQAVESSPLPISPAVDQQRKIVHATAGHLGVRCDSWMDSERHINKSSSLRVDWWTLIDETLPIMFAEPCGLLAHNKAADYPLDLVYQASTLLRCFEAVTAFEVRYMTFNVWGEHVSTLVATEVRDVEAAKRIRLSHAWHLYSENEADEFCASLGFVSRARLSSGIVRIANTDFVLREAQRIAEKVTEADLEPKPPKRA